MGGPFRESFAPSHETWRKASDNCIRHVYCARESLSHKIKPSKTKQRLGKGAEECFFLKDPRE